VAAPPRDWLALDSGIGVDQVSPIFEASRPLACLAAASVSLLGSHLVLAGGISAVALVAAGVVILLVSACNLVNDVTDLSSDRRDHPDRPLPSGRIKSKVAVVTSAALGGAGLALAATVGWAEAFAAAGFLLAGIAYSVVVRRAWLLGHLWVAGLFGATALWGGWVVGKLTGPVLWAAGLVALFILPRELLKSLGDVSGDTNAGWMTAAVVLGRPATLRMAALALGAFAVATLVPVARDIAGLDYLVVIWLGAVLPFAIVLAWIWPELEGRQRRGELLTSLLWFPGLAALWQLG
jgi:geranylgeranylglycerol-phosphate geranylgeranyltransferase